MNTTKYNPNEYIIVVGTRGNSSVAAASSTDMTAAVAQLSSDKPGRLTPGIILEVRVTLSPFMSTTTLSLHKKKLHLARITSPQAICDTEYRIIAWTMNCPGSQNDRIAFKFSGFHKLLKDIPEGHYILGDAAYPASDKVLVPFPGTNLSASQDAYNFYQSQCRMAIEQTFGILVRFIL